jgi:peptidoglycan/LPS O-acetylase OafA/YrhL
MPPAGETNSVPPLDAEASVPTQNVSGTSGSASPLHAETYRPEIDGLRAFAVLAVLIYHFFPTVLPGGLIGVDVFFVISGYLICRRIHRLPQLDAAVLLDFYSRRIRRIFPALLAVLLGTFGFGYITLYADQFKELAGHLMAAAGFLSNFISLREAGYFDAAAEQKPLLHLWSLAVEEQFYLILPVAFMLPWLFARRRVATLLVALLSFFGCLLASYKRPDAAYYLPVTRFWEILCGALLAFYETPRDTPSNEKFRHGADCGILLLLGAAFFVRGEVHYPGWQALAPVLGACLIIGSPSRISTGILANRVPVWIGLISYPLYLWHWPVVSYLKITELQPTPAQKMSGILLTLLLTVATYYFIEKPVRHRRGPTTALLLLCMVAIGVAGQNVHRRGGLDFRRVNYQVYKQNLIQSLGTSLGINTNTHSGAPEPVLEDREYFDSLFPDYASHLRELALRMKADPAFYARTKEAFRTVNNDALFQGPDSQSATGTPVEAPAHVVILGDSHAANLHTALAQTHPDFCFTCFSDSGCTPILARYRDPTSRGRMLIERARKFLQEHRVDLLILAARWPESFHPVAEDLAAYKTWVPHIALAGPSPVFRNNVSDILLRYDGSRDVVAYTHRFADRSKFALNAAMKAFALNQGVSFIDRLTPLCPAGICRLTSSGEELFIFDSGHLTPAGARELGNQLRKSKVLAEILK